MAKSEKFPMFHAILCRDFPRECRALSRFVAQTEISRYLGSGGLTADQSILTKPVAGDEERLARRLALPTAG